MSEQELYKPTHYTTHEGGRWLSWPEDETLLLEDIPIYECQNAVLKGKMVHSLLFKNSIPGEIAPRRWDCVNGFNNNLLTFAMPD